MKVCYSLREKRELLVESSPEGNSFEGWRETLRKWLVVFRGEFYAFEGCREEVWIGDVLHLPWSISLEFMSRSIQILIKHCIIMFIIYYIFIMNFIRKVLYYL